MAQGVGRRSLSVEAHVRSHVSPCEICVGHTGTGASASASASAVPCQCHSTMFRTHLHLSPKPYNLSNWRYSYLQHFSPPPPRALARRIQHRASTRYVHFRRNTSQFTVHQPSYQRRNIMRQYKQTYGNCFILNLISAIRWNNNME
jgi:hypothetical protein